MGFIENIIACVFGGLDRVVYVACSRWRALLDQTYILHEDADVSLPTNFALDMKASMATFLSASIILGCSSFSSAFVVPTPPVRWTASTSAVATARTAPTTRREVGSRRIFVGALSAEPAEETGDKGEEQEPMDLDLEQMFEVKFMIRHLARLATCPPSFSSSTSSSNVLL